MHENPVFSDIFPHQVIPYMWKNK